jgi:hypothetical protein
LDTLSLEAQHIISSKTQTKSKISMLMKRIAEDTNEYLEKQILS